MLSGHIQLPAKTLVCRHEEQIRDWGGAGQAGAAAAPYLLLLDDVDAGLDVGEGVHGGQDGLPLVLLAELSPRAARSCEGRGEHEAPEVEVLLEVGQPVLHLVVVEIGLCIRDLDVCLEGEVWIQMTFFFSNRQQHYG